MNLKKLLIKILFFTIILFSAQQIFAQVNKEAQISPQAMQQIQLLLQEKESRNPAQQKMDSRLLQASREKRGEKMAEGVSVVPVDVDANANGDLKVDIDGNITDALLLKLKMLGAKIIYPSAQYHTVRAAVNLSMVETIAGFPEVRFIQPAVKSMLVDVDINKQKRNEHVEKLREKLMDYLQSQNDAIGSVTSQGDVAHRAADVRNDYGFKGAGIKIGVLSDSYNDLGTASSDVTGGDLPGTGNPDGYTTPVTVVEDISSGGEDEGRAMLQVIHDIAPAAQLYFATADVSEADFANNITKLRNTYGCNIIIDDVAYYDEPAFQDGIVAQAVNTVTAAGALYFSSAGNSGSLAKGTAGVFEGDFNDAGSLAFTYPKVPIKAGTVHNFGTVASPVNGDILKYKGQGAYTLIWSDAWGASGNDYDLFLISSTGTLKGFSTTNQTGAGNPYEQIAVPAAALAAGDRLVVFKKSTAAVRALHLNSNRGELTVATNGQTTGHACAVNAYCVAATPAATAIANGYPTGPYPNPFNSSNTVEPYSSDGPRRMFYNPNGTAITANSVTFASGGGTLLAKPEITAADGVNTTLPSSSGLNPFFGTSCAAPHAGAIAALLLSAKPTLTASQIKTILTTSALDIESAGYDNVTGYGIVQAYQAMQQIEPAITVTSALTPTSVTTTYGTASGNMTFSVKGGNMNAGILIASPPGFEVSLASGSGFGSSVTVGAAGTIASTPVYVRLAKTTAAGSYSGNIALTSSGAPPVNIAIASSTVNKAALTITANNGSKIYGQIYTVGAGSTAFTSSTLQNSETIGTITIASTGAVATAAAGTYNIVPSAATGGTFNVNNYTITYTNGTLTVTKAALTVTANNQSKVYGAADPSLTYQITSGALMNGDVLTGSLSRVAGENVGTYSINQGSLSANNNYTLTFVAGTLTVTKAVLTVTSNDQSKVYGSVNPALTVSYSGFINSDNASSLTTQPTASTTAAASSAVGTYPITASGGVSSNYTFSYVNGTLTITKAVLTVTSNDQSKVYGSVNPALTVSYSGFVNSDNASSLTTQPTANTTATTSSAVGAYAITAGGGVSSNYTFNYVNGTLTITKATLTVTANDQSKVYGAANPALTVGYSGFANSDNASSLTTQPTASTTATASSAVGTYAITASGGVSSNYTFNYVNGTLTITKAALTVTANDQSKVYGAANPALTVGYSGFVNSDNASSLTTQPTANTTATTSSAVGTYPITASGGVSSNYTFSYVAGTLTITKATLTVTPNDQSKVYGSANPALTVSYSGFINSDNASLLTTQPTANTTATTSSAVGTYPITASGGVSSNYTFSYVNGTLTITKAALTVTANDQSKVYGAADPSLSYQITSGSLMNGDVLTGSLARVAGENVGTYSINQGSLSANNNYTLTFVAGTLTITKAALTVTANDQSKVYGAADPTFTYQITSGALMNGDVLTGSLARTAGEGVGTYAINQGSLSANNNYTLTFVAGTLTITKAALIVTANDQSKVYGAADPSFTYQITSGALMNGDVLTGSLARTAGENVGTYSINQGSLSANNNYTLTFVAGTLTVTKAALTVTANDQSKVYGAANPALTVDYSGFVNGDNASSLTTQPTANTTATTSSAVGTYAITASGGVSSNYTFNYVNGTLTITQASLTVTADDQTKVYGAADPSLTYQITSGALMNGDVLTGSLTRAAGEDAGTYNIRQGSLSAGNNYILNFVHGTFIITQASLTIIADDKTMIYGGAVPALTASYNGFVNGDNASSLSTQPVISTSGTSASSAGSYTIFISGASDNNYSISYTQGALTINQAALIITANNATKCNGATQSFIGTEFNASGLVNGDAVNNVNLSSTGALASAAAGNYPIIPSSASGTGLSNYVITYNNGTLTVESPVVINMIQVNPDCHGDPGSLSSTVTGGISPYTYKVNTGLNYDPSGTFISNPLFSPLAPGYYAYAAKDANGCLATATGITIAAFTKEPILISNTIAPATVQVCYGSSVTISTNVVGGNGPYTYSLNGGSFVSAPNRYFSVGAGTYYITVMDSLGCTYNTDTISVSQPSQPLTFTTSVVNANCRSNSGALTVTGSGGYGTYSYSIDNGNTFQQSGNFTALMPATYNVAVKDVHGCIVTGAVTLRQNLVTTSAIIGNNQVCYGSSTAISTTPSGGVSPYQYSLDGGNFVSSNYRYFSAAAGVHTITVMDAQGCTAVTPAFTITQPSAKTSFTATIDGAGCTSSGTISITASNGYGGYAYSNNGGVSYQAGATFSGLGYGSYTVAVKDQNGCAATSTILKLTALTSFAIQGNLTVCPGASTTLSTVPAGGIAPYFYSMDGGAFVPNANRYFSVKAGTHAITVKDNVNCTYTTPSVNVITVSCLAGNNQTGTQTAKITAGIFKAAVYPNPALQEFHLQIKSSSRDDIRITVTNILGEKVYEAKGSIDNTYKFGSSFTSGIYILRIMQGNDVHVIKLVKGN